jgi:hypothetical protein
MTATAPAGTGTLEFSFDGGELHVGAPDVEMKIRAWPDPRATIKIGKEDWKDFRPEFRLLKPPDSREPLPPEAPGPVAGQDNPASPPPPSGAARKNDAFAAFRASIPPEVVSAMERFQSHQWNLIDLISQKNRTMDLLRINPSLASCFANCDQFRKYICSSPAAQASRIVGRKQRDILSWLDFPATESMVRIFKKIVPEAIAPSEARMLRNALHAEPTILKLLAHQPVINTGILGIVTNLKLLSGASPKLLTAVGADEREAAYPHTAERLLDVLWMLWRLNRQPVLPHFESIESVREAHDAITQDYQRVMAELNDRRKALHEARKARRARKPVPGFQPPPVPGTEDIIPLISTAQLQAEGRSQNNCVGSYGRRVMSGSLYIYKVLRPERATLAITKGSGGCWRIAELEAAKNRAASKYTRATVERWLALHSMSV